MGAMPVEREAASPLSRLTPEERVRLVMALAQQLPVGTTARLIAALGSTPKEAAALPDDMQDQALQTILDAFPPGYGAWIVSRLGIARVGTDTWLSALHERFAGKGVDAVIDEITQELPRQRE